MSAKTMASYIAKANQMRGTSQRVKTRSDESYNNAGGVSFTLTPWQQLERFLILGSEGGTYHVNEKKLTVDNVKSVEACIREDGVSVVDMAVDISKQGRAPKNDPALLVLALCAADTKDPETRGYAMAMLPEVARTGTHLFHFVEFANALRGWGRLMREGIANWYNRLDETKLALQVIKYQQRDGWSHRDLMRLSHPNPGEGDVRKNLYKYIVKGSEAIKQGDMMPQIIVAAELAKTATTKELVKLIVDNNLPRECVPTTKLNEPEVWEALLQNMPMTAMIRNLAKMTSINVLRNGNEATVAVVNAITDAKNLKNARVHPLTLLVALHQYSQGHGDKGSLSWTPLEQIKNALNEAFYESFGFLQPSDKKTMLAIDISGSMTWPGSNICGTSLKAREGAAAMAMISLRTEPEAFVTVFSSGRGSIDVDGISEVKGLTPQTSLDNVIKIMGNFQAGGTDCALPMVYAARNNIKVDTFAVYTDSETWAGGIKPFEALRQYRDKTGIPAKLVVVGMASNNFTIADPNDAGMLDVVGFDTATPQVIADFSANRF